MLWTKNYNQSTILLLLLFCPGNPCWQVRPPARGCLLHGEQKSPNTAELYSLQKWTCFPRLATLTRLWQRVRSWQLKPPPTKKQAAAAFRAPPALSWDLHGRPWFLQTALCLQGHILMKHLVFQLVNFKLEWKRCLLYEYMIFKSSLSYSCNPIILIMVCEFISLLPFWDTAFNFVPL